MSKQNPRVLKPAGHRIQICRRYYWIYTFLNQEITPGSCPVFRLKSSWSGGSQSGRPQHLHPGLKFCQWPPRRTCQWANQSELAPAQGSRYLSVLNRGAGHGLDQQTSSSQASLQKRKYSYNVSSPEQSMQRILALWTLPWDLRFSRRTLCHAYGMNYSGSPLMRIGDTTKILSIANIRPLKLLVCL